MGARFRATATLAVASLCVVAQVARGDEARPPPPPRPDATIFETSARVRSTWTEIPFRPNRPKGWDEIVAPEARISLRVLSGLFEAKAEAIVATDHFAHFEEANSEQLRGEAQIGINTGAWSFLLEWRSRTVFAPDFEDYIIGQNAYGLRVRRRFSESLFDGLPAALFQASAAGGYVASTPSLLRRNYAELELECVQPLGGGFAIIVTPKLELTDYDVFPGDRQDAAFFLRVTPIYNFGDGVTLSLEGQAMVAFSTLDNKTGEAWDLTPILRIQKAL